MPEDRQSRAHQQAATRRLTVVDGGGGRFRIAPSRPRVRLAEAPAGRPDDPAEGTVLAGRYRLEALLGRGGIGSVYRAEDQLLHMPVAVKVLTADLALDPEQVRALKEEAKTAMALAHPSIVRLHTLHEDRGRFFLVMEQVEGRSLRSYLNECGHFEPDVVRGVVQVVAGALAYAHARGVLHNDVKPDNLLLSDAGVLKIIDFGLASLSHAPRHGPLYGTPEYISPERLQGKPLDPRADLYSLAMTVYELLTGRLPFPDDVPPEKRVGLAPGPLAGVAEPVRRVLARALAAEPAARPPDVQTFASELAAALAAAAG